MGSVHKLVDLEKFGQVKVNDIELCVELFTASLRLK